VHLVTKSELFSTISYLIQNVDTTSNNYENKGINLVAVGFIE
jgi:hypothetical protein